MSTHTSSVSRVVVVYARAFVARIRRLAPRHSFAPFSSIESPINPPCTTILSTCTFPRQPYLVTVERISPPRPSSSTPRRVPSLARVASRRVFAFASIVRRRRRPSRRRTSSCAQYHRARAGHPSHVAPRARSLSRRVSPRPSARMPDDADHTSRVTASPPRRARDGPHRRLSTTTTTRRARARATETTPGVDMEVDGRVWRFVCEGGSTTGRDRSQWRGKTLARRNASFERATTRRRMSTRETSTTVRCPRWTSRRRFARVGARMEADRRRRRRCGARPRRTRAREGATRAKVRASASVRKRRMDDRIGWRRREGVWGCVLE